MIGVLRGDKEAGARGEAHEQEQIGRCCDKRGQLVGADAAVQLLLGQPGRSRGIHRVGSDRGRDLPDAADAGGVAGVDRDLDVATVDGRGVRGSVTAATADAATAEPARQGTSVEGSATVKASGGET
ncbi:MAG: hypothetical protein GY906_23640 [bacterium]|nr:hypothetical protein [bacterium]